MQSLQIFEIITNKVTPSKPSTAKHNSILLVFLILVLGCHPFNQGSERVIKEEENLRMPVITPDYRREGDWKGAPERTEQLKFELYYNEFGRIEIPYDSIDRSVIDFYEPMLLDLRFGEKLSNKLLIKVNLVALEMPFWFDLYQKKDNSVLFNIVQLHNTPYIDSITLVKRGNIYQVEKANRTEEGSGGVNKVCLFKVVQVGNSVEFEPLGEDNCYEKEREER